MLTNSNSTSASYRSQIWVKRERGQAEGKEEGGILFGGIRAF